MLAFAADAGPFVALGGQDAAVTGVGVAPPQVVLQPAGQSEVIAVVAVARRASVLEWAA